MKKIFAIIAVSSICLSGCAQDPYTGEDKASKSAWGAGLGALAGAAIGSLTGDGSTERRQNAMIGAGIGAVAGGGAGYYMDRQEAKLRDQLRNSGVSVTRVGDDIILNMPSNITFASNSSNLQPHFYKVLNSVSLVLGEFEKTYVDVSGHTDSTGAESYNQQLSNQRANAVGQYLIGKGVIQQRVLIKGYGESSPVASNTTSAGRAANRRVEIKLTPVR